MAAMTNSEPGAKSGVKKVALSINFDSMPECMKLAGIEPAPGYRDPCFGPVMDRFLAIAAQYGARFTIFMIGRDLEDPSNAEAVARWHSLGHEIANHSYSHRQDMGQMGRDQADEEIGRAHDLIAKATGVAPRGFVAPGWAASNEIVRALRKRGYLYDSSLAPSWVMALAQLMLYAKSSGARKMIPMLRPDTRGNLFGNRGPYVPSVANCFAKAGKGEPRDLVMLPLPTVPFARFPVWHTLSFAFPPAAFRWMIRASLRSTPAFYYLFHPADLIDPASDLDGSHERMKTVQRMDVSLAEKERRVHAVFEALAGKARFATFSEIAQQQLRELSGNA